MWAIRSNALTHLLHLQQSLRVAVPPDEMRDGFGLVTTHDPANTAFGRQPSGTQGSCRVWSTKTGHGPYLPPSFVMIFLYDSLASVESSLNTWKCHSLRHAKAARSSPLQVTQAWEVTDLDEGDDLPHQRRSRGARLPALPRELLCAVFRHRHPVARPWIVGRRVDEIEDCVSKQDASRKAGTQSPLDLIGTRKQNSCIRSPEQQEKARAHHAPEVWKNHAFPAHSKREAPNPEIEP
jgi:hypothetical protein